MDDNDERYFNQLVNEYGIGINESLLNDIKQIWYDVVEELVYYRQPIQYDRTFQLRDKFKVEIIGNEIYAYVDTEAMEYYSFGRKDHPVSGEIITHIIDVGHNYGSSPYENTDYFNNYPARHIIEEFADRVKQRYPEFQIEIIRDTPSVIE